MTEQKVPNGKKEIVFKARRSKDSELNAEEYDTVVLKNLVPSTEISDIKDALEEVGYKVFSIRSARSHVTGLALPIFFIKLYKSPINATIFQLKYVAHQVVVVEQYLQGPDLPRCTRCQDLDHIKTGCINPPVCAWCSGSHYTTTCKDVKIIVPTCCRCGGSHPSSYKGCKVYRQMSLVKALEDSSKNKAITIGHTSTETSNSVTIAIEEKKPMTSNRMITSGNSVTSCSNSIISTNSSIIAVYNSITSGNNSIISPSPSITNSNHSITRENSLISGNNSIIVTATNSMTSLSNSMISADKLNITPYLLFPANDIHYSPKKYMISTDNCITSSESLVVSESNSMVSTKHSNKAAEHSVTSAANSIISAKNFETPLYSMFSANMSITSANNTLIDTEKSIAPANYSFFSDNSRNSSLFSDSRWNIASSSRTAASDPLFSDKKWNISSPLSTSPKQNNTSSNNSFLSDNDWSNSSYTMFSDSYWNTASSLETSVNNSFFPNDKWEISSYLSITPKQTNTSSNNSFFPDIKWNTPTNNSQISDDNWSSPNFSLFSAQNPTSSSIDWSYSASGSSNTIRSLAKSRFSFVEKAESKRISCPPGFLQPPRPEPDPNAFGVSAVVADVIDHFSTMNEDLYQKLRELD